MEVWEVTIEADAEVIPGPLTQMKWALEHINKSYNPEEPE